MTGPVSDQTDEKKKTARNAAIAVTIGAAACAACCVLPFAAPAALLAGAGSALGWFGRIELTLAAVALVAIAWLWVAVRSARVKKRPAASTLVALSAGTLILAGAVAYSTMS